MIARETPIERFIDQSSRVPAVAVVRPFRALRYGDRAVPPVVAPPYDVISPEERERLAASSPHNVVHLTLPDVETDAARLLEEWQRDRVLVRDDQPAMWWLEQEFVGPDGVRRTRTGLVTSLRLEPYERRVVLPHERTHAGPKEGRLRLLRATRVELEPIFLLFEGALRPSREGEPELTAELAGVTSRLWRAGDPDGYVDALHDAQLLIADGHHRYETALAFHEEEGTEASAWLLAVVVPAAQEGLAIFPTHRLAASLPLRGPVSMRDDPRSALAELEARRDGPAAAVVYTQAGAGILEGDARLDVELVDRLGLEDLRYTPDVDEAIRAVDAGEAEAALLVRPARIEDVWALARAGETMPQKTTYFYPKLASGLLMHPLAGS
jgi:uncharacterized protein (DUF1015 family)